MKKIHKIRSGLPVVVGGMYYLIIREIISKLEVPLDSINIIIAAGLWGCFSIGSLMLTEQGLYLFSKKFDNEKEDD